MTESEKAQQVLVALQSAEAAAPDAALQLLNGLVGLVRSGGGEQPLEVEDARASAFLAICEIGKALHRAEPAAPMWRTAIAATERWVALAR